MYFLLDIATFTRRKGSKDKRKRKVTAKELAAALNKPSNPKLNAGITGALGAGLTALLASKHSEISQAPKSVKLAMIGAGGVGGALGGYLGAKYRNHQLRKNPVKAKDLAMYM